MKRQKQTQVKSQSKMAYNNKALYKIQVLI